MVDSIICLFEISESSKAFIADADVINEESIFNPNDFNDEFSWDDKDMIDMSTLWTPAAKDPALVYKKSLSSWLESKNDWRFEADTLKIKKNIIFKSYSALLILLKIMRIEPAHTLFLFVVLSFLLL